jgi:hypothetical protein
VTQFCWEAWQRAAREDYICRGMDQDLATRLAAAECIGRRRVAKLCGRRTALAARLVVTPQDRLAFELQSPRVRGAVILPSCLPRKAPAQL